MTLIASVALLLIQIACVIGACYLVLWFLDAMGLALPARVMQVLWVIAILVVVYVLAINLAPLLGGAGSIRLR